MLLKLDKDCVRDVLVYCEKALVMNDLGEMDPLRLANLKRGLSSYSDATIKYTVKQLIDAEYLDARIPDVDNVFVLDFYIFDITYEGHEFLENIKNDNNWSIIKEIANKIGSSSVDALSKIAASVITTQINNLITGGLL